MHITKEQEQIILNLGTHRLKEVDINRIHHQDGPLINGRNHSHLLDEFRKTESITHDQNNHVNSYIVENNDGEIIAYFSLRCGELFDNTDINKMIIGSNAFIAAKQYGKGVRTAEIMKSMMEATNMGLDPKEWKDFHGKKVNYIKELKKEPIKELNRVLNVHSAIELKFFGITQAGRNYWKSLGMPQNIRLGETVFWMKILPLVEKIQKYVGCKFLYLFAADQDADGSLVNYYKSNLHFDNSPSISVNKPKYDYQCIFLYKEINELLILKEEFKDNFNPDPDEEII